MSHDLHLALQAKNDGIKTIRCRKKALKSSVGLYNYFFSEKEFLSKLKSICLNLTHKLKSNKNSVSVVLFFTHKDTLIFLFSIKTH